MKCLGFALTLTAAAILTGCVSTTRVRTDLAFKAKSERVPNSVLIVVPDAAKNHVAEAIRMMYTWRVPVGQALEPNALRAFATIVENVTSERAGAPIDYTIELSFDSQTGIRLGTFTFSANTCIVGLKCDIKDATGAVVWTSTARGEASKSNAFGFLGGLLGHYAYNHSLGGAANAAIGEALQKLTDEVEANRHTIFQ